MSALSTLVHGAVLRSSLVVDETHYREVDMRVRSEPWLVFVALAGLGCPAPVVPTEPGSGESTSTATGGSSDGPGATSLASDTTSDGTGHDTTAGTTTSSSTGTTAGGADFGEVSDGPVCHQCCGNGAIDGTELCDCGGEFCTPAGLNFAECAELTNPLFPDRIYTGGVLE